MRAGFSLESDVIYNALFPVDYHLWLFLRQSYVTKIITTNLTEDYGVINLIVLFVYLTVFYFIVIVLTSE